MPNTKFGSGIYFWIYVTNFLSEEGNEPSNSAIYLRKMG